jgi:hypothetical protein
VGLGALILAGCSKVETLDIAPPAASARSVSTTSIPPPTTTVPESAVVGTPTTVATAVGPGDASLNGTVFGPQGPVKGATVLVERIVEGGTASASASTATDGSWRISNILGGRYVVRAWMSPSLADTSPQVVYLSDGQVLSMAIEVSKFQGPVVSTSVSPADPVVGQAANLAVQVFSPVVGPDGVVRNPPSVATTVSLVGDPGWVVTGTSSAVTGQAGVVIFQITCRFAGDDPLSIAVGAQPPTPVQIPACLNPPPPTTTTSSTSSTTTTPTTSTTLAGSPPTS